MPSYSITTRAAGASCCRLAGRRGSGRRRRARGRRMRLIPPLTRSRVTVRSWPFFIDLSIALCALAAFFAVISTGVYWLSKPVPVVAISTSIHALPVYAFYSLVRMAIAYCLSLAFAVTYGYIAAYNSRLEPWMIAALDIL